MKKPNPIAESFADMVERIRQDERTKLTDKYYYQFRKVEKVLAEALAAVGVLLRGDEPAPKKDEPAPKRKTVTATPAQVFNVHDALVQLHGAAVSIKNLRGATGVGPKIIGSALRALVKAGSVVEGPRGRFKAASPTVQTADGATSETP